MQGKGGSGRVLDRCAPQEQACSPLLLRHSNGRLLLLPALRTDQTDAAISLECSSVFSWKTNIERHERFVFYYTGLLNCVHHSNGSQLAWRNVRIIKTYCTSLVSVTKSIFSFHWLVLIFWRLVWKTLSFIESQKRYVLVKHYINRGIFSSSHTAMILSSLKCDSEI